jgi:hypothetical protein
VADFVTIGKTVSVSLKGTSGEYVLREVTGVRGA